MGRRHVGVGQTHHRAHARGVKVIGLSVDSVDDHVAWSKDIEETQGQAPNYPMIGDSDMAVAKLFDEIGPLFYQFCKEKIL